MKANKVLAAASAAVMAMGMLTVPAMASSTCSLCGGNVSSAPAKTGSDGISGYSYYTDSTEHLTFNEFKCYTRDGEGYFVAEYDGEDICFSCLKSVAEKQNNSITSDADGTHTGSTNVTAEVPGDYTITVPETVELTGDTGSGEKTATVKVTLKGDVAEDQTVTVTVNDPVMKRSGAQDVPVAVTAPKTSWNRDELLNDGTSSDYVVKATLTPGDWTGIMTFECNLA